MQLIQVFDVDNLFIIAIIKQGAGYEQRKNNQEHGKVF